VPEYPVSPPKVAELESRMARLGIRESDIDESFVRSSGAGGQNVNKVSTCVQLVHRRAAPRSLPARAQPGHEPLHRRRLLCDKIEEKALATRAGGNRLEKIRRQKRKRSKRAKERILEAKRHNSSVKAMRGRPSQND